MPASTASLRPDPAAPRGSVIPLPTPLMAGLLPLSVLTVLVGIIAKEQGAVILGACFLAIMAYAFVSVFAAALLRIHTASTLRAATSPREISPGDTVVLSAFCPRRFLPPGVSLSYEIKLETKDGRILEIGVDPERAHTAQTKASSRGAYYASHDVLLIFDGFGLFEIHDRIPADKEARLLVMPGPLQVRSPVRPRDGGSEERRDASFRRTDDLTDSRKYAPGDDPRRINWKLYGHSGELFLREGEIEPPPKARYLILLDSTADPVLFDREDAALAVDSLAERALGAVGMVSSMGCEAGFAFNGSSIRYGTPLEAALAFAHPSVALPSATPPLPLPEGSVFRILLFALPRTGQKTMALDHFLAGIRGGASVDLRFVLPPSPPKVTPPPLRAFFLRPPHPVGRTEGRGAAEALTALREEALRTNLSFYRSGSVHAQRSED